MHSHVYKGVVAADCTLFAKTNTVFSGTLVIERLAHAVVVATGKLCLLSCDFVTNSLLDCYFTRL